MNPSTILKVVLSRCPQEFHPTYLLETEIEATSLIKRAWILGASEWIETNKEFNDPLVSELADSAKIKFFIKGNDLHCFVNDKAARYFDHFVLSLTE